MYVHYFNKNNMDIIKFTIKTKKNTKKKKKKKKHDKV